MANTKLTLPQFIKVIGVEVAAEMFNVSPATANSWKIRRRYPRPEKADLIVRVTKDHPLGPIDYESIYKIERPEVAQDG